MAPAARSGWGWGWGRRRGEVGAGGRVQVVANGEISGMPGAGCAPGIPEAGRHPAAGAMFRVGRSNGPFEMTGLNLRFWLRAAGAVDGGDDRPHRGGRGVGVDRGPPRGLAARLAPELGGR